MLELYTQPHAYGAAEGSLHQHPQQAYDRRVRYTRHQHHRTRSTHSGFFSNPRNPVLGTSAAPFKDATATTLQRKTQQNSHARRRQLLERARSERSQAATQNTPRKSPGARNQTPRGNNTENISRQRIVTDTNFERGKWGGDARAVHDKARGPGSPGDEWKQTSHGRCEQQRVTEKVRLRRWTMLDGSIVPCKGRESAIRSESRAQRPAQVR